MNMKTFGEQIDIHGGGRDLIFPHHENEIAQTEALTGKQFVKYWIHNGLIKVNGQKMSKSLGNSVFLKDLLDRYSDETVKLALLQSNYRSDLNITDDLFPEAEKHLTDFYKVFKAAEDAGIKLDGEYADVDREFDECMDDDFNTALAISNLYGYFKKARQLIAVKDADAGKLLNQIKTTYSLLGLFKTEPSAFLDAYAQKEENVPAEISEKAAKMQAARAVKDYATADALRAEITAAGFTVQITKDGVSITRK